MLIFMNFTQFSKIYLCSFSRILCGFTIQIKNRITQGLAVSSCEINFNTCALSGTSMSSHMVDNHIGYYHESSIPTSLDHADELVSISRSGLEFVGNWLISSPPLTSLNMFIRWRNLNDFHKQINLTPFGTSTFIPFLD